MCEEHPTRTSDLHREDPGLGEDSAQHSAVLLEKHKN